MRTITAILLALLLADTTEIAGGKVVGVTDGDTLTLLVDRQQVKIRLEGIDAPESSQSYGARSKEALSKLVFGKHVRVRATGKDKYGRTLGVVVVGTVNVNEQLVRDGWAWHFLEYSKDKHLAAYEKEAREAKRGLWAEDHPLPPWEFRDRQRTPAAPTPASSSPETLTHWLNTSSNVRHNSRCEHFKNTKRGRMCSPDEGKSCGICGG